MLSSPPLRTSRSPGATSSQAPWEPDYKVSTGTGIRGFTPLMGRQCPLCRATGIALLGATPSNRYHRYPPRLCSHRRQCFPRRRTTPHRQLLGTDRPPPLLPSLGGPVRLHQRVDQTPARSCFPHYPSAFKRTFRLHHPRLPMAPSSSKTRHMTEYKSPSVRK